MDADSGLGSDLEPDLVPTLDEFLLARIAEDRRIAVDAARAAGREDWGADVGGAAGPPHVAEHVARHDPARVVVACAARRRLVMACRDSAPDHAFLGARPEGLSDFLLTPRNQHQLAALTLALLALPYADHHEYRPEWRP